MWGIVCMKFFPQHVMLWDLWLVGCAIGSENTESSIRECSNHVQNLALYISRLFCYTLWLSVVWGRVDVWTYVGQKKKIEWGEDKEKSKTSKILKHFCYRVWLKHVWVCEKWCGKDKQIKQRKSQIDDMDACTWWGCNTLPTKALQCSNYRGKQKSP